MEKSPEAFRTISEVAEWLDVPTHVLRFWESRFAQVKPVKRAGGRRYYRPSDMRLIGGIKKLLHEDGMTIRGVQKLLREEGVKYVSAYSRPLDSDVEETAAPEVLSFRHASSAEAPELVDEATLADGVAEADPDREPELDMTPAREPEPEPEPESDPEPETLVQFDSIRQDPVVAPELEPELEPEPESEPEPAPDVDEIPELPFIGSARDHPRPVFEETATAAPQIPATPDVPATDAADDAPDHRAHPGPAARLIAAPGRGMIDVGTLTEAALALRALRDRPHP
ncbi:MAG: MerR family transcriptional regulator [Pseudomonadota bacterium]